MIITVINSACIFINDNHDIQLLYNMVKLMTKDDNLAIKYLDFSLLNFVHKINLNKKPQV